MNEFQKDYLLKRQDYGVLYPYVMEETVTDIHWNGRQLWIDDLEKGRYMAPEVLSESFANRFSMLLSNLSNKAFNRDNPVMEVETSCLSGASKCCVFRAFDFTEKNTCRAPAEKRGYDRKWLL